MCTTFHCQWTGPTRPTDRLNWETTSHVSPSSHDAAMVKCIKCGRNSSFVARHLTAAEARRLWIRWQIDNALMLAWKHIVQLLVSVTATLNLKQLRRANFNDLYTLHQLLPPQSTVYQRLHLRHHTHGSTSWIPADCNYEWAKCG